MSEPGSPAFVGSNPHKVYGFKTFFHKLNKKYQSHPKSRKKDAFEKNIWLCHKALKNTILTLLLSA